MSYQVMAQKWRPRLFDQVVGQDHVVSSLSYAFGQGHVFPAYLFSGPRGVGKTTLGRIVAKALNCRQGVSANPCGQCDVCVQIDQGRYVDLIEIDAASKTKVEDTRALLDGIQYAPSAGPYKVYLIDEVHMLSTHSFNALLKTLEEPPEFVRFVLATTDPHKVPDTVLSRCVQYHLQALKPLEIKNHIEHLLKAEQIGFEQSAINLLAKASGGSVRDALMLTEQLMAAGQGVIKAEQVENWLGMAPTQLVLKLSEHVMQRQTQAVFDLMADNEGQWQDYTQFLLQITRLFYELALYQVLPEAKQFTFEVSALEALSLLLSPSQIQVCYQICLKGQQDLAQAPDEKMGFEMIMLRLCAFVPVTAGQNELMGAACDHEKKIINQQDKVGLSVNMKPSMCAENSNEKNTIKDRLKNIKLNGIIGQIYLNSDVALLGQNVLQLIVPLSYKGMLNASTFKRLNEALNQQLGQTLSIKVQYSEKDGGMTQQQDRALSESSKVDPNVDFIKNKFSARVEQ